MELFKDTEKMTREELLVMIAKQRQTLRVQEQAIHAQEQTLQVERQKNAALRFVLGVARALAQGPLPVELDCNPLSPRRLARVEWIRSMQTCGSCSISPDYS